MIDWYKNRYKTVVREKLRDLKNQADDFHSSEISDAIQYFNRQGDVDTIRWNMVKMFATRTMSEDEIAKNHVYAGEAGLSGHWNFERGGLDIRDIPAKRILGGQVEALTTGFGPRIVETNASLFTQKNRLWSYVSSDQNEKHLNAVETLMQSVREESGFDSAVTQMDLVSCMVESSWLHIYYKGRELRYDVVQPQNMHIKFGNKIVYVDDLGKEIPGWVDRSELEDASAVVIRLASDQGTYRDKVQYLAYVGCNEDCPDGRYVVYTASQPFPIPDPEDYSQRSVDAEKAIEYEHTDPETGQRCNPLTWLRNHGKPSERAIVTTEYPVCLFRGGHQVIETGIAPTSTSLYQNSIQIEIAWTRCLRYALKGARGVDVWKESVDDTVKPTNTDMIVIRGQDSDFVKTGWPAGHSQNAANVVAAIVEQVGGGFHVPGYFLLGKQYANPPSGVALALEIQPLIDFREHRIAVNSDQINRLWEIERAQLVYGHAKDVGELLQPGIRQRYKPGKWNAPGDPLTSEEARTLRMHNGVTDLAYEVMEEHGLKSIDEALKLIDEMKERDPGYKGGKKPEPTQPVGIDDNQDDDNQDDDDEGDAND
jgi:hypothetical protein